MLKFAKCLDLLLLVALGNGCHPAATNTGTGQQAILPKPSPAFPIDESIRKVCRAASRESLTVQQLAQDLGSIQEDYGGSLQVVVHPRDPAFSRADIVRRHGTQEVALVDLKPASSTSMTVATLCQAFGEYEEASPKLHRLPRIIFRIDSGNPSFACSILVNVMPGLRGVRDGSVSVLTVLPEKR